MWFRTSSLEHSLYCAQKWPHSTTLKNNHVKIQFVVYKGNSKLNEQVIMIQLSMNFVIANKALK